MSSLLFNKLIKIALEKKYTLIAFQELYHKIKALDKIIL